MSHKDTILLFKNHKNNLLKDMNKIIDLLEKHHKQHDRIWINKGLDNGIQSLNYRVCDSDFNKTLDFICDMRNYLPVIINELKNKNNNKD